MTEDRQAALELVALTAQKYRAEEQSDTPRLWRGKRLQDLADYLDKALEGLEEFPS